MHYACKSKVSFIAARTDQTWPSSEATKPSSWQLILQTRAAARNKIAWGFLFGREKGTKRIFNGYVAYGEQFSE